MTRPFRILFACPQTLFDVSNGATMQCYTLLQMLSKLGFQTASFGGGIFDNPSGAARIPQLEEQLKREKEKLVLLNIDRSANPENPIRHVFFTGFKSKDWNKITSEEASKFLSQYSLLLRKFKPDLVLGFGCDALCRSMWMEAKLFGIPTGYIICNGNHQHYRFPLSDVLLCDSHATAAFYKEKEGLTVHPMGNFINPALVVSETHEPRFVTFINPAFAKGAAIAARLILMANRERPDIPFQIVETRQKFVNSLRAMRAPDGKIGSAFPNNQTFRNLLIRPATFNVKEIYETARVLLAPSLWYESWGRVATEAVMNGIPVLASTSGGLPEAVAGGGICLPAPKECGGTDSPADWNVLPSEESCRPWAEALYRLYDDRSSAIWQSRCEAASRTNSLEACAKKFLVAVGPLLERMAGDGDFRQKGSIRYDGDPIVGQIHL